MPYFTYGDKEMEYLTKKDKKLGAVIARIGKIEREVNPDLFASLISSIVGQQISNKAAETVWRRFCELIGEVTPENILAKSAEELQKCGMSFRKVEYIRGVAASGLDVAALRQMSDEELVRALVGLPGVGEWTAEMLMIFSLERPDILSYKDLAIRRGMMQIYGLKELSKERFLRYKKRYSPYGSVASLYIWEMAHPEREKAGAVSG